jgi:glycosyltransferase involved in cell wall biosynthesis/peptidoglycan/xylan/chitin deacetylase (PgdA/CDA1 family)
MIELSIVIPTYNRAKRLRRCLEALNRQTHAESKFEVVVVVDGSTDNTMETLKSFEAPYLLRTIWQENTGQAAALNRGILEAKGRYILFLDDDIVADPRLIAEHLQAHRQHPKAVVIGQITLSLPPNAGWYTNAFAQGWRDHYDRLNREMAKVTWEDCYSGNMSTAREALLTCEGFDVTIIRGFDVELASRLEKQGSFLFYMPNALGCQQEDKGFRQLSRDAENAGKADVQLYRQDPLQLSRALASFAQGSWRKLLLRRLLLMFHIPPSWLELLGRFIKNPARRYSLYSVIETLCYWRGVRQSEGKALWRQLTYGTPILMYHAIGSRNEPASRFVLPVHRFEQHIAWMKRLGYQPISLRQFLDYKKNCLLPPARSVVITFDDGYADNYSLAYPVLRSQNIPATIFVVSNYIGRANEWDRWGELADRPLMSWSQLQELASQGVQIGAHSCTHRVLTEISESEAREEIIGSHEFLASNLGVAVDIFAYPYGEYDESMQTIAKQAGFAAGCTADAALNTLISPDFALQRTEIRGDESFTRLFLALWTGNTEALWRTRR